MAHITFDDLERIRQKHKDQKVVFCSGSFDLTHAGHALFLEDCKRHGDILVAMVGSDEVIKRFKGENRPVMNEHLRLKMVDSLKPVDYTFINYVPDYLPPDMPQYLSTVEVALEKLRPDVYIINKDAQDIPPREQFSKKHGVPIVILDRTAPPEFDEVSTTKIIKKIKST